jgi:hypothetical protein
MVLDQFMSQSSQDYTLDVFVSDSLQQGVTAAYSQSQSPDTLAWAVCFNVLILLSLGAEPPQGRNMDLFLRPYVDTLQAAVGQLQALMVPKLVYVQALALLVRTHGTLSSNLERDTFANNFSQSVAAQQYSTPQVSDNVFAQTCVLAKTMGLHQSSMSSEHLPSHEAIERRKVFRSLYIRDKALAISRGSPCWLPSVECSLFVESNTSQANEDPALNTRLELADLQFECYRLLHSNHSQHEERHDDEFRSLHERLNRFSRQRGLPTTTPPTTLEDHDLNLSFLATRLYLLSSKTQPGKMEREQILHDARMSCLLLLPLKHADHTAFLNMFDFTVASMSRPGPPTTKPPLMTPDNMSDPVGADEQLSYSLYRLALAFPATSLVHLTRHIIFSAGRKDSAANTMDLELLRALYALLMNPETSINASTHVYVIAQTLEKLLRVTDVYSPGPGMVHSLSGESSAACSTSGLNDVASLDLTFGSSQGCDTKSPSVLTTSDSLFGSRQQSTSLYYSTPPLTDGLSLDGEPCMPDVDSQWPTAGMMDLGRKRRRNMTDTGSEIELDGMGMDLEQWDAGLWSQMSKNFVEQ